MGRPYTHDVFISYTHSDNEPLVAEEAGWVTQFHKHLQAFLLRRLGRTHNVSVWRDDTLRGNDAFNDKINEQLRSSAVLVCILSPAYQSSPACQAELKAFSAQNNLLVGNKHRIFKVVLCDVPLEEQLEPLKPTLGYRFFDADPKEGWAPEMWPKKQTDPDQRYWIRLHQLAEQMAATLREVGQSGPGPADAPPTEAIATVYLSEVTEDLDDERQLLKSELAQHGVRMLLPDRTLPNNLKELEPIVTAALRDSDIAVHFFAERYGKSLVDDPRSLGHVQYELAAKIAGDRPGKLKRVVWIPPEIKDKLDRIRPEHRQFLESIENESGIRAPDEIHRKNFESLKELILSRIKQLKAPVTTGTAPPPPASAMIIITGAHADFSDPDVSAMIDMLKKRYEVYSRPVHDAEMEQRLRETSNIKYCDGLIALYGSSCAAAVVVGASESSDWKSWVEMKALQANEINKRRHKKRLAVAIYDGPPLDKEKFGVESPNVLVLNCRDGFAQSELQRFLDRVDGAGKETARW